MPFNLFDFECVALVKPPFKSLVSDELPLLPLRSAAAMAVAEGMLPEIVLMTPDAVMPFKSLMFLLLLALLVRCNAAAGMERGSVP